MSSNISKMRNRATNIAVFVLSFVVYSLTMSPTASLWDCGEFISSATRLEVGHPSGAPTYWLIGRLATMMSGMSHTVAWWCNALSVVASALAVMLLCSVCRFLFERIFGNNNQLAINVSAAVSALTLTFSDSVWYSAVESEVYALSLFFFILTLWLLTRLLSDIDNKKFRSVRWLYLSCLIVGLSIGVHQMNLLALPFIIMSIAYAIGKRTWGALLISFCIGCVALIVVQFALLPGVLDLASMMELLFVNYLCLPCHSGLIITYLLLFIILFAGVFATRRLGGLWHLSVVSVLLILIGYTTHATIIIRANARPNINLCEPTNVFELKNYLDRNMYGSKPMLRGAWYNAEPKDIEKDIKWHKSSNENEGYYASEESKQYIYDSSQEVWFPRMSSALPHHRQGYSAWAGVDPNATEPPTVLQELTYTFRYQLGFMYFRYLMWNFVGRQNDIQGNGNLTDGNWISGIDFIDQRIGQRYKLHPDETAARGKATYYLLPFIIGIVGICVLVVRRGRRRWGMVLLLLFLLTGPALAIYLNQDPYEPRERDYVYLFSFLSFAIFIGIGAMTIIDFLVKRIRKPYISIISLIFFAIPTLMACQNWAVHDRSGRTFDVDMARSYLDCCAPDAILFTNADNDTYPLWYVQEVEGYRRDVSVINYGLLGAEWYVAQMFAPHENRKQLKSLMDWQVEPYSPICPTLYVGQDSSMVFLTDSIVSFVATRRTAVQDNEGDYLFDMIPYNLMLYQTKDSMVVCKIATDVLSIQELSLLDLITSNSNRPIYTTNPDATFATLGLNSCVVNQGLVSRLINKSEVVDRPLNEIFLENINLPSASQYYQNADVIKAFEMMQYRAISNQAAEEALYSDDKETAKNVLYKSISELPISAIYDDANNIIMGMLLYEAGDHEFCREVLRQLTQYYINLLQYYTALSIENEDVASIGLGRIEIYGSILEQVLAYTGNDDMKRAIESFEQQLAK